MNKRLLVPTLLVVLSLIVSGCGFQIVSGSGKVVSETRTVGAFSRISLAGIGNVIVSQGEPASLRIEAEDNLIPYFDTTVQGDTLTIGIKQQYIGVNLQPTQPINFYVTSPKVDDLTLAGSGNIQASALQSSDFSTSLLGSGNITIKAVTATTATVRLTGSGNITIGSVAVTSVSQNISGSGDIRLTTVTATKIATTIAGSGNVHVDGTVTDQNVEILGSGDYLANGLSSSTATVRTTGSGSTQVKVSDTLDATILGSGDVVYSGTPRVSATVSGSGKVTSDNQ